MSKVIKLVIEVGDKRMEFTPEEAKELKQILDELYGKKPEYHYYPTPYVWPHYPYTYWGTTITMGDTGVQTYTLTSGRSG